MKIYQKYVIRVAFSLFIITWAITLTFPVSVA